MNKAPDFTILLAADAAHADELAISYSTWMMHKPSLASRPIVVMCDLHTCPEDPSGDWWRWKLRFLLEHPGGASLKFCCDDRYAAADHRAYMLSQFISAVRHVSTPYYLKLDSDTIATGCDDWINPKWFWGGPEIVAPAWGYTKPASQVADFNAWSDLFPDLFPHARVNAKIVGNVAKHRRFISYCQFGNTAWTRKMAKPAEHPDFASKVRLPIPSQDGYLSMCAERSGALVRHFDAKAAGWRHVGVHSGRGGIKRLAEAAAESLRSVTA